MSELTREECVSPGDLHSLILLFFLLKTTRSILQEKLHFHLTPTSLWPDPCSWEYELNNCLKARTSGQKEGSQNHESNKKRKLWWWRWILKGGVRDGTSLEGLYFYDLIAFIKQIHLWLLSEQSNSNSYDNLKHLFGNLQHLSCDLMKASLVISLLSHLIKWIFLNLKLCLVQSWKSLYLRFYYKTYNSKWFTLFTSGNIKGTCCLEEKICHLLEPMGFKCTFINYSVT